MVLGVSVELPRRLLWLIECSFPSETLANSLVQRDLNQLASQYGLQGYHVAYIERFLSMCDVRGRDVLEVGGAIPREIAIDFMGANSWTALESGDYHGHDGILNQRDRLESRNAFAEGGSYSYLYKKVEDLADEHASSYDVIFSIACFEHIHRFPLALEVMFRVLRPGGSLFSLFAPIWSSMIGAHLSHIQVPERYISLEQPDLGLFLEPWEHLVKNRYQLHDSLAARYDDLFAQEVVYQVFDNPHINRYFFEDYVFFVQKSRFDVKSFVGCFTADIGPELLSTLRARFPGYRNFSSVGMEMLLSKPAVV